MFWTLGERRIAGNIVPTVAIVRELLETRSARFVDVVERDIPRNRKRMALRNDSVDTMSRESVLIMRAPERSLST